VPDKLVRTPHILGKRPMALDLQVLEFVCSRLCHDLVSPIGAVGNGLELMAEEPDAELLADAHRLVEDSARRAAGLLQLYRCAYGNAGSQLGFGAAEAVKLAKEVLDDGRIALKANVSASLESPRGYGKMVVNGILTTIEWLPRGGALSLSAPDADGFTLSAEGQQAGYSQEIARLLQADRSHVELSAHNIQPYLTGLLAAAHGYRLALSQPVAGTAVLTARRDG
jgi:histidine phosphotransferase ChpT